MNARRRELPERNGKRSSPAPVARAVPQSLQRHPARGGTPDTQRERAAATRSILLDAARRLFAERGYHATSVTEIVTRARVTRGALYHHFTDKEDLFLHVFRQLAEEHLRLSHSAVAPLRIGFGEKAMEAFREYLRLVASHPEYQRVLLIDGPSVLGWKRWRDLQNDRIAQGASDAFRHLMDTGPIQAADADTLARLVLAALYEAALEIAHSPDPAATFQRVGAAFSRIVASLLGKP